MGNTGITKRLASLTSLVAVVGLLLGLTVSGCGNSGDTTPAVIGGSLEYQYNLLEAKTDLPLAVSYIKYEGNVDDYAREADKAETVLLTAVPVDTTGVWSYYYDENDKIVGFGYNNVTVTKGATTTVSTPSFVAIADIDKNVTIAMTPATSVIKVGATQEYKAEATFKDTVASSEVTWDISTDENTTYTIADTKVADVADGAAKNIVTGLTFGTTDITPSYKMLDATITGEAVTLNVVDGTLKSIAVRPVSETIDYSGDVVDMVNPVQYDGTTKVGECADGKVYTDAKYAFKNAQFTADATFELEDGTTKELKNVEASYKLTNETLGAPFTVDGDTVAVAATATAANTDTLTGSYTFDETTVTDTIGLNACEMNIVLFPNAPQFDHATMLFTITVGTPATVSACTAQYQIDEGDGGFVNLGSAETVSFAAGSNFSFVSNDESVVVALNGDSTAYTISAEAVVDPAVETPATFNGWLSAWTTKAIET